MLVLSVGINLIVTLFNLVAIKHLILCKTRCTFIILKGRMYHFFQSLIKHIFEEVFRYVKDWLEYY